MAGHKTTHTQIERFRIIDSLFSDGKIVSFEALLNSLRNELKDFKLSDSSLRRDIRYMRDELGAPFVYDKKNHGWKYSKPYKLPANSFSDDEILNLYLIKKLIMQTTPHDFLYNNFNSLLERISPGAFSKEDFNGPLSERFLIPLRPELKIEKETAINIVTAIKNNLMLDFTYYSRWEPDDKHRIILPYQLVIDFGSLFLYGADYRDKENPRLFKLAKMHNVQVVYNQHFELPKNFRFKEEQEQGRFGAFQYDEYYDFKIEFYGQSRSIIHEYVWSENQLLEDDPKEGKTILSFTSSQWEPIQNWLLSFGAEAKPLEPDWFVEEWKETIRKMATLL